MSESKGRLHSRRTLVTRDKRGVIHTGDCLKTMERLRDLDPRFDLVYADPPFNIGRAYDVVDDSRPLAEYLAWTKRWISLATQLVAPHGSFVVNCPDAVAAEIVVEAKSRHMTLRRWMIWHYRFGQNTPHNFISSKVHVLYFVADKDKYTWNGNAVLEPSDRAVIYGDPRTRNKKKGVAGMRVPFDVWQGAGFCRIQGNNRERRKMHDNQIPLAYFSRVVRAMTDPKDTVLDVFAGSGGLGVVCRAFDREYAGCEKSNRYALSALSRINNKKQVAMALETAENGRGVLAR